MGSQTHPINAPIKLTFSVDMIATGGGSVIDAANIGLFTNVNNVPTTAITTTKTYDSASKTVTLTPSANLTASTDYVVKVNATATSTTSAALNNGMNPYMLFFKTASGVVSPNWMIASSVACSSIIGSMTEVAWNIRSSKACSKG